MGKNIKYICHISITLMLIIAVVGCGTMGLFHVDKEYAYLAPYVKNNSQWGPSEYDAFLAATKDKHLLELYISSKSGNMTEKEINALQVQLKMKGGREALIKKIKNDILWDYSNIFTYPFKDNVPYHEIAGWVAGKKGSNDDCSHMSSYKVEKSIINAIFTDTWNHLTEEQKKEVIANSDLKNLTKEQKQAIIAGSGTVALATIATTTIISGFAFYTTMTSVICASASVFGLTMPFAVYTTATTAAGILSGPAGWIVIGVAAIGTTVWASGPNVNKTCEDIIAIHMLKAKALRDAGELE